MTRFFGSFSESFMMAVLFGVLASILLTGPILGVLYHRRNRLDFGTVSTVYASILYVFGLGFFTLYPFPDHPAQFCATHHLGLQLNVFQFINDLQSDGASAVLQIGMNVVFFLPLGFLLKRLLGWRWFRIVPIGFAVSLLIESAQGSGVFGLFPCAYRLFDVDDLISNTIGALVGMWLGSLFNRLVPRAEAHEIRLVSQPGFIRRLVAFIFDATIAFALTALSMWAVVLISGERVVPHWASSLIELFWFLLVQLLIPVVTRGRTLAGQFVHMTCETKQRTGWVRVVFYLLRFAIIYYVAVIGSGWISWAFILALLIFWLVKRCMPYDLLPGQAVSADQVAESAGQSAEGLLEDEAKT